MNTKSSALFQWLLPAMFLVIIAFILLPSVHAQEIIPIPLTAAAAPATLPDQVVAWLTPLLVPVLLAGVKQVMPRIPSWVIPMLAPVLGLVIGVVNNLISAHSSNLWLAAGLGLLGVAVREVKESIAKADNGGWPASPPVE